MKKSEKKTQFVRNLIPFFDMNRYNPRFNNIQRKSIVLKKPNAKSSADAGKSSKSGKASAAKVDLVGRTSGELLKLKQQIEKRLESQHSTFMREAYGAMQEIAEEYGTTVEAVVKFNRGTRKKQAKKTVGKPQFRNPADPEQTWTGRGKRPNWIINAVNSGTSLESMRIK